MPEKRRLLLISSNRLQGLESFDSILKTFKKAKLDLGEILSSCEMVDADSLDVVTGHLKLKSPIDDFPFYMLIETQGSDNVHDEEKLNKFLESAMEQGLVLDGTATNEATKMKVKKIMHRKFSMCY